MPLWAVCAAGSDVRSADLGLLASVCQGNVPTQRKAFEWLTNWIRGTIFRIDPQSGEVTDEVYIGAEVKSLAAGQDGGLWARYGDWSVARFDPDSLQVTHRFDLSEDNTGYDWLVPIDRGVWVGGRDAITEIEYP